MSWLGVKYALSCRDERVKGGTRLVFVALGVRVDHRRITTAPTSLGDLKWLTLMSAEQIRRILDDLEAWRLARRLSRGKNAIYALPGMAGPLFAVDDGDPVKMTDFVLADLPKEIGQDARKVAGRMTGFRRRMTDFAGVRAGGVLFSQVLRTEVPTSTAERAAAEAFLAWVQREHAVHNRGAMITLRSEDIDIACELLAARDVDRLKAMCVALWTCTPGEDHWCAAAPEKGLRALRHAADRLDRISRAREGRAVAQPAPARDIAAERQAAVARAIAMLERHVGGVLGTACAHAACLLRAPGADVGAIDASLLAAARAAFDVADLEQRAHAELAPFRGRMPQAEYDKGIRLTVDRLLRARAQLPDLGDSFDSSSTPRGQEEATA